jgi:4,5-dihydroxyphthalate decarboxylase
VDLTVALTPGPRTQALLNGTVGVEGARLVATALTPGDMFLRQLKYREFDVSELSLSSLTIAIARGARDWLAIPVFATREVFHAGILVRDDGSVQRPEDLRGKRVGVLEYQQTSVVWIRGALQHEFGVRDVDVEWFMERAPETSHGGATGFAAPPGVRLNTVPPETSLGAMLEAGEIDAILFYPQVIDQIDRRANGRGSGLRVRTLFPDPAAEARRYVAKTGILPINHCVVVRRSLAERDPSLPGRLLQAFIAARPANEVVPDASVYGLDAARLALETLARYVHEQRLVDRIVGLDELFGAAVPA